MIQIGDVLAVFSELLDGQKIHQRKLRRLRTVESDLPYEETELGRINMMLSEVQTLQTPLTWQMDQFGRWLTMAILIIAGATFAFGALTPNMAGHGMVELFMATVGLAVAKPKVSPGSSASSSLRGIGRRRA